MDRKEKQKLKKIAKRAGLIFGLLAILLCCILAVQILQLDISISQEYQGHYYLAERSGSPAGIANNLEIYLEKVEQGIEKGYIDRFGYAAFIYKTPENQIAGQIKVVESFLERTKNLEENPGIENIGANMALGTLKQDMQDRYINIYWYKICEGGYFYLIIEMILCILFVILWFSMMAIVDLY